MTIRVLCSTGLCDRQAADLCHMRQRLATARYERDAALAQASALAADNARLRAELDAARAAAAFYMGLYCEDHAQTPHAPAVPKNRG